MVNKASIATHLSRRDLLASLGGACGLAILPPSALAQVGAKLAAPRKFSHEALVKRARKLAMAPYAAPRVPMPELLERIDYDAFQRIRFRPRAALWDHEAGHYPVQLFHLGRYFTQPVRIHRLEGSEAREVRYSPGLFEYGEKAAFASALAADAGFSGFRLQHPDGEPRDWLAFLGASYFRSSGELDQYGLSARGVAIDTASDQPEEFPRFSAFWIAQPERGMVRVHALLEGPSITGAFRIDCLREGAVVNDIDATLFARKPIARLGIAPLTSMYWYGERDRHLATDWRPEIHDSDGLALHTGSGERLWRPLNNPAGLRVNTFADSGPRGFGLLQRDRAFPSYEDDGVFYERRPSAWVEPLHDWGKGAVMLVEIPTADETDDNIVAAWVPASPVKTGDELRFRYRLHWTAAQPGWDSRLAYATHSRIGRGGIPGQPRPPGVVKLVVDFAGGELGAIEQGAPVEAVVDASAGEISNIYALRVVGTPHWRAFFDYTPGDEQAPVNLRCYLRMESRTLSETWLHQYLPGRAPAYA